MSEVYKLGISNKSNQQINEVNSIDVLANQGVVGDRHFKEFNAPYNQLSLIAVSYTHLTLPTKA